MANAITTLKSINDIFDIPHDTNDGLQFAVDILNQYYRSGQLQSTKFVEEKRENDVLIDSDYIEFIQKEEQNEENILSQKLSELTTKPSEKISVSTSVEKKRRASTATSPIVYVKKLKTTVSDNDEDDDVIEIQMEKNEIPPYLCFNNKLFIRTFQDFMNNNSTVTIHDIQKLANLFHQIGCLKIKKERVTMYLKAVTGTLIEAEADLTEVDRRIWPMPIQSMMLSRPKSEMDTNMEFDREKAQHDCENLLHEHLQKLNEQIEQHEQELMEKKKSLSEYTSTLDSLIQNYVQEYGMKVLEIKNKFKKQITFYDYESELLERQYLKENPNSYQLEVAKRLVELRRHVEKSKRDLLELKQRVLYNKSSIPCNTIPISTTNPLSDNGKRQRPLFNTDEKQLQWEKLDVLSVYILEAELTYYRFQYEFDNELAKMWQNHRQLLMNKAMTTGLTQLLEKRFNNIENRWRDIYNFRMDYYVINSYDELNSPNSTQTEQRLKTNMSPATLYIDTRNSLNEKQSQLLCRGPSYVPSCLMYTFFTNESMNDIVKKQFAPLQHQLMALFQKYKINVHLCMEIQDKLLKKFQHLFSSFIPATLFQRAMYEKNLIQSIQYVLDKNQLILRRTADNMNTFYLSDLLEFERKAERYLTLSDDFEVLIDINDVNNEKPLDVALKDMINSMNLRLNELKTHKALKEDVCQRLMADPTKTKLPYLYFLPNISQDNSVKLVPVITSHGNATWKIAKFLNQHLRPYIDEQIQSTTFYDEADFLRKFHQYATIGRRLKRDTLFCTIKIMNYHTLDTHKQMLDAVEFFLNRNLATNKLQSLTIQTIRNLLHLFLHNNIFYYKDNIYKFVQGSPNTVPLTETLANVYMNIWQNKILKEMDTNIEFFGRYKDQIFFTWNKSTALQLETFIEDLRLKHRNVHFQKLIGTSVSFLNVYLENRHGILYSRVYYDPNIPRYTLPYVTGHAKTAYSSWLRTALIHAVCSCTSVDDFQQERIYLELTFLSNGYSLLFVESNVKNVFTYFNALRMKYSRNQMAYDKFRQQCFDFIQQRQRLSQELQKFDDHGCLTEFNYICDFGPSCRFNRDFLNLWHSYFPQHPYLGEQNYKILISPKDFHSLNSLLAKENPCFKVEK